MAISAEAEDKRAALEALMATYNLRGQWQSTTDPLRPQRIARDANRVSMEPSTSGVAHCWKWERIAEMMELALDGLPESLASRRALIMTNPALKRGTTHTLVVAYQVVAPGELAWAHRHSVNALRLGIEGSEKLYTVVDGVALAMEPYDLLLTPGWQWHEHHNETGKVGYWLDCLDVPFTLALNQSFYEELGEARQERIASADIGGSVTLRPAWLPAGAVERPYRYPWKDTLQKLTALSNKAGSPHEGIALDYVNPVTGGATLSSIGCRVHWLPPGFEGKRYRKSSSQVHFVIEGRGATITDEVELDWSRHDSFVIPNWTWQRMRNASATEPAIVFTMSDAPILEKFGFYREERES